MASVQELIAAQQAEKSPFISLMEGLVQGTGQGIQAAPERMKTMLQIKAMQQQQENDKAMNEQLMKIIGGQADAATTNGFNGVKPPSTPPTPGARLIKITKDARGNLDPTFEALPPKAYQQKEYQDAKGINRLGAFDPVAGRLTTNENDPLAPKPASTDMNGMRQDNYYQKEFDKLTTVNDPNNASSRTAIGMLGRANLNAQRAMITLNRPVVSSVDAGNLMAEIASIYQGGSPTQFGMSEQQYKTLHQSIAQKVQYLTGNPTDALPKEVVDQLKETLMGMAQANSSIIKRQLDSVEASHKKLIGWAGTNWSDWRKNKEEALTIDPASGSATPPPAAAGADLQAAAVAEMKKRGLK